MATSKEESIKSSLRRSVSTKKPEVWKLRQQQCVYLEQPRAQIEKHAHQVDHVLEIQMLDKTFYPISNITRQSQKQFSTIVNDSRQLNITTAECNMIKMGAVKSVLNATLTETELGLLDTFRKNKKQNRELVLGRYDKFATNVCSTIVETYDSYLEKEIQNKIENPHIRDSLCDNLNDMLFNKLKL